MKKDCLLLVLIALFNLTGCEQPKAPEACGPVPTEAQLKWQELERYAFIHFSMNTFTDMEWGYGDKDPQLFNPSELDCRQWCRLFKDAGMKGVILTVKHHDGFCLWPSAYTDYSVKQSPWRNGNGDLVRELADACKEYGLKLGIYLSPWDRNHKEYGTEAYITYFRNQLNELLTNYGDIFEVWFDGANGGSGYYGGADETRSVDRKTYYDWPGTNQLVKKLQPDAVIFSDAGPDVRWCGNEAGWVGETNWSTLRREEVWPGWPHYQQLQNGHEDGSYWVPAEVNVSIRPGWFYHEDQDEQVKTVDQLLDVYYHSVGRNATWNLNIPIDKRGLVHPTDSAVLMEVAKILQNNFKENLALQAEVRASNVRGKDFAAAHLIDGNKDSYWATDDEVTSASVEFDFKVPTAINQFLVQEYIRLGQRVKAFTLEAFVGDEWQVVATGSTIGYKRILRFPTEETQKLRFTINDAKACPLLSNVEIYRGEERNIKTSEEQATLHSGQEKSEWKVLSKGITPSDYLLDGNYQTVYRQAERSIVVDLANKLKVKGFQYLPNTEIGSDGLIFEYKFEVSEDGKEWQVVKEGEFSNIQNNPVLQTVSFEPVQARYVKLSARSVVNDAPTIECAELDVVIE